MNVTFLESKTFFPSSVATSSLQGEIREKELNRWNWPGFEDNLVQMSNGNEAMVSEERRDNLDIIQEVASESSEPENEKPHSSVPEDKEPHSSIPEDPSPENTPKVSSPITTINDSDNSVGYTLPFKHNRGKPPHQYSLDSKERRSRYPIANYVSTQRLPKPPKEFVHKLSSHHIPNKVQEALSDPSGLKP